MIHLKILLYRCLLIQTFASKIFAVDSLNQKPLHHPPPTLEVQSIKYAGTACLPGSLPNLTVEGTRITLNDLKLSARIRRDLSPLERYKNCQFNIQIRTNTGSESRLRLKSLTILQHSEGQFTLSDGVSAEIRDSAYFVSAPGNTVTEKSQYKGPSASDSEYEQSTEISLAVQDTGKGCDGVTLSLGINKALRLDGFSESESYFELDGSKGSIEVVPEWEECWK